MRLPSADFPGKEAAIFDRLHVSEGRRTLERAVQQTVHGHDYGEFEMTHIGERNARYDLLMALESPENAS